MCKQKYRVSKTRYFPYISKEELLGELNSEIKNKKIIIPHLNDFSKYALLLEEEGNETV